VDIDLARLVDVSVSPKLRQPGWRVVAMVVGVTLLVMGAGQGLSLAASLLQPQTVQRLDDQDRALQCLRTQVERSVPAGASVYVPPDPLLWDQRVIESTYPRYRVVSRRTEADYVVRVTPGGRLCAANAVSVERLR
jgi:hypothetical protein